MGASLKEVPVCSRALDTPTVSHIVTCVSGPSLFQREGALVVGQSVCVCVYVWEGDLVVRQTVFKPFLLQTCEDNFLGL